VSELGFTGLISADAAVARGALGLEVREIRSQLRALARRSARIETLRDLELESRELAVLHASLVDAADALELVDGVLAVQP
jgi:hypothetical protein